MTEQEAIEAIGKVYHLTMFLLIFFGVSWVVIDFYLWRKELAEKGEISMRLQFNVEYEAPAIRSVQAVCPACSQPFDAIQHGILENGEPIQDADDLKHAAFDCPHCGEPFDAKGKYVEIQET